jgi:hypothetical protein
MAMDAAIESEDVLLLSYAYTGDSQFTDLVAFATSLAATDEYGFSLQHLSLRHAVLSMAASDLDPVHFEERAIQHKAKAWESLMNKIKNPTTISEADVFASCILAMLAWETGSEQELTYHVNGCMAFLKHMQKKSPSKVFQVFKPYVMQWMDYLTTIARLSNWPMVSNYSFDRVERITFNQRVEIFDRFLQVGVPQRVWYAGVVDALHDILTDAVQTLALCIYRIADKERLEDFMRARSVIEAIDQVNHDLSDVNLQAALQEIRNRAPTSPRHTYNEQLDAYQLHQVEGIELAQVLLHSSSILEGLASEDANCRAEHLLSSYQSQGLKPNQTVREFDWLSYPGNILLSAMALAPHKTERNFQFTEADEVKIWVVKELAELPSPLSPEPLQTFWSTRSIDAVVEVLKQGVRVPGESHITVKT